MNPEFTIVHISDLHFSKGTAKSNHHHTHSIIHLQKLQEKLSSMSFDKLIVSGDISNGGDKESLLRARDYLYGEFAIGGGEVTGLKLEPHKVGIVPGNHDAWNRERGGSPWQIWQRSLKNYNDVFVEHRVEYPETCYYEWLDNENSQLFIAYVDSCYLGEQSRQADNSGGHGPWLDKIAKGKLSHEQSTLLLEWFDRGTKGLLPKPGQEEEMIPKGKFCNSLKILVMHHYIFEPPEFSSDYLMRIKDRDVVFRNIAMADFDILLCGHKHAQGFDTSSYGDHFDRRAKDRYLLNYFRRLIGIHSLPVQFYDDRGRRFSKAVSNLINLIIKMARTTDFVERGDYLEELGDTLIRALKNPERLEHEIKRFLQSHGLEGEEIIDSRELKEIRARISTGLTLKDRQELKKVAKKFNQVLKHLSSRPFLQIMCGSTTKASQQPNKNRGFNVYKIFRSPSGIHLRAERYVWDSLEKSFSDEPLVYEQTFEGVRILLNR